MDRDELDMLARRLASPVTRRSGFAALVGGLLGLAGLAGSQQRAEATRKAERRKKRKKQKNRKPPTSTRCRTDADCPIEGQRCVIDSCTCVLDSKSVPPCGDVCCSQGQRCHEKVCRAACTLPLQSEQDYRECDFSGQTITGSFYSVNLDGANLRNARFEPTWAKTVSFRKAKMQGMYFKLRRGDGKFDFDGGYLDEAVIISDTDSYDDLERFYRDFSFRHISGIRIKVLTTFRRNRGEAMVYFEGANIPGADLSNSEMSAADFRGANLANANLRNTDLSEPDFSGANLDYADLRGALLRDVTYSDTSMICTFLPNGDQVNCPG